MPFIWKSLCVLSVNRNYVRTLKVRCCRGGAPEMTALLYGNITLLIARLTKKKKL